MGLHFIIGNAGEGKTTYLYQTLLKMSENNHNLYLFVPEQATLQAQKDLTAMHPGHCIMNCDILGFRRLSFRLLEELGNRIPTVLEDTGKSMIVKLLLLQNMEQLGIYRGKERKRGFVSQVKSMISEFSQYTVTVEDMEVTTTRVENDPILVHKLKDLTQVYRLFHSYLEGRFVTEEDIFQAMCPLVAESSKLAGATLFFDGYTGFTPSQYCLLDSLMKVAKDIYVTVTIDPKAIGGSKDNLFRISENTIEKLTVLAEKNGICVAPAVITEYQNQTSTLRHLKQQIFRYPVTSFRDPEGIHIASLSDRREEVRYLVTKICELVQKEGFRYREIGVLCGDVEGYAEELRIACSQAAIPCFIDYKTNVLSNPLVDLLRALCRIVSSEYRADAIGQYMKNPLSGFTSLEASEMENYLLAMGIRGHQMWSRAFTRTYKTKHRLKLDEIEALRQELMRQTEAFYEVLKAKQNVREVLTVLYTYMVERKLSEMITKLGEQLADSAVNGKLRKMKEYSQIYQAVITLINDCEAMLGDEVLSADEFAAVLDAGFEETKLGVIPPEPDVIMVGDVKRSRINQIKVLFFLGVNEGVVPGFSHATGLLTDRDREKLEALGLTLADTAKKAISTEEFYLYLALSKPTRRLYLTYRRTQDDGKELRASYVIYRILRIFPALTTQFGMPEDFFSLTAADGGREAILTGIEQFRHQSYGDRAKEAKGLLAFYEERKSAVLSERSKAILRMCEKQESTPQLSRQTACELYGQTLRGSVSRLECFAKCAYQHFLRYGLNLEARPERTISNREIGTFYHRALYLFSERLLSEDAKGFRHLEEQDVTKRMEAAVQQALLESASGIFLDTKRNSYQVGKMKETLVKTVMVIGAQLVCGDFDPVCFERPFVHAEEGLELKGVIDRIDWCDKDVTSYLKVVDYKSGNKTLNYVQVYDGISVQLPLYLREANKLHPGLPLAALYSHIDNPIIDKLASDHELEVRKAFRPEGIVMFHERGLGCIDHGACDGEEGLSASYHSTCIPLQTTKDRKPCATLKLLTEEDVNVVLSYVDELVHKEASEIMEGKIAPVPYKTKDLDACKYCEFSSICNFDERSGMECRTSSFGSSEEAIIGMKKTLKEKDNG